MKAVNLAVFSNRSPMQYILSSISDKDLGRSVIVGALFGPITCIR